MKLFLIFSILLLNISIYSQNIETGLPSIRNFTPKEYGQECQNYCIVQDTNMIMYFGNSRGIMEFDNSVWSTIKTIGTPIMDVSYKNEIFFGSYNQVGKIAYTNGKPEIKALSYDKTNKIGQIKKVVAHNNDIFFVTGNNQLLRYNEEFGDSVKFEFHNAKDINIFKYNNKLIIYIPNRAIYYWENEKLVANSELNKIKHLNILDIINIDNKNTLIKPAAQKGFYKLSSDRLTYFYTDADDFIEANIYTCSKVLENGNIIIGTRLGGIVCIDNKGRFLFHLNKENGLNNNHITDMYIGKDGYLWVSTYNGISLIESHSNISFFNSSFGLDGIILSILRYNNELYVGTSCGLFKYKNTTTYNKQNALFNTKSNFYRFDEIKSKCRQLQQINNNLLAITEDGIYKIDNNKANIILAGNFKSILALKNKPNHFLAGCSNGLILASISESTIDTIGFFKNINNELRTLVEDYDQNIWIGTNRDGLYKISFKDSISIKSPISQYTEKDGLPENYTWVDVFDTYQGILFSTSMGVYCYNYSKNTFYADTTLSFDFSKRNKYIYPIIEDKNKDIWYSCTYDNQYERETGVLTYNKNTKKYSRNFEPYIQLSDYVVEAIYPDNNKIVWLGSLDALIKIDNNKLHKKSYNFKSLIRKVTIGNDNTIYIHPNDTTTNFNINLSNNKLRFDYTAISYNTKGQIKYKVKLEGFDKLWSEWTDETFKDYTSLKKNKYKFKVIAKDVYGNESEEISIEFSVIPPFYNTFYAYIFYVILFICSIFLLFKYISYRHVKERYNLEKIVEARTNELSQQKARIERLIKKLLPQKTAKQLQETGNVKTEQFEMVTVLFADIHRFTEIAERTNPEELINHLNNIFKIFDNIISGYNIQKIKTIGDAYMCAGGMPTKNNTNPVEVVLAAIEMQRKLKNINDKNPLKLEMRVGVHTGPVVAGIVGESKIEYDIWGDTVNIASRMESKGHIGKVNISSATHKLTKDFFDFEYRGKIEVKYKGEMKMYFIDKIKSELTDDGINPNKTFNIKLQNIQYKAVEDDILKKLQDNLQPNLYYHNVKHTIDVIYIVENIAKDEKVSDEDMLLLKCAALFHDTGFMVTYDNNEEAGASIAEQALTEYNFNKEQIETVKRLILATRMPHKPKDLLEKIICDADLDYLGRPDFIPISQNLFRELLERGKIDTIIQWNKMQYKFIRTHSYYTETERRKREIGKQNVLKELEEMI